MVGQVQRDSTEAAELLTASRYACLLSKQLPPLASPCGLCLQTWWSQSWAAAETGGSPSAGGRLVEAAWGPDCRSLLLAYEGSPQVG